MVARWNLNLTWECWSCGGDDPIRIYSFAPVGTIQWRLGRYCAELEAGATNAFQTNAITVTRNRATDSSADIGNEALSLTPFRDPATRLWVQIRTSAQVLTGVCASQAGQMTWDGSLRQHRLDASLTCKLPRLAQDFRVSAASTLPDRVLQTPVGNSPGV